MHKCWNCGTEHEDIAADAAYNRGYMRGYEEASSLMNEEKNEN